MNSTIAPGTMLHNLVLFGRLLRKAGLNVTPARLIVLIQALNYVEIGRKEDFYYCLRSLLVQSKEQLPIFDRAFALFWRRRSTSGMPDHIGQQFIDRRERLPIVVPPPLDPERKLRPSLKDPEQPAQQVVEVSPTYSSREALRQKDFSQLTEAEVQEVRQFMAAIVWELGSRKSRRKKPGKQAMADLRRTMRRNLRYGGEFLDWSHRQPKLKPRPLIIIADISGSMERYTRLLLHFLYGLAEGLSQPVEGFVFSTRLTRITRQLHSRSIEQALLEVSQNVHDWAGGTRIGDAVKHYNFEWSRRVKGQEAITLLISDGWDRGDPELLSTEMCRLQRSCHRLIWLNPLLGSPRYRPLTRGMQAALPYVDDFLPVHNVASLEELAAHLMRLTAGKRHFSQSHKTDTGEAFSRPS